MIEHACKKNLEAELSVQGGRFRIGAEALHYDKARMVAF